MQVMDILVFVKFLYILCVTSTRYCSYTNHV